LAFAIDEGDASPDAEPGVFERIQGKYGLPCADSWPNSFFRSEPKRTSTASERTRSPRGASNSAPRYLGEFEACCQQLADDPERGRSCDQFRPGLFRYEQGKHVIFCIDKRKVGLELVEAISSPEVTHVTYAVKKR